MADLNCDNTRLPAYSGFGGQFSLQCLSDAKHIKAVSAFLTTVMDAVAAMTPGPYIHVGGDETPTATTAEYTAYVKAVSKAVTATGHTVVGWHNLAQGPLDPGTLLQYWGLSSERSTVGTGHESADIKQVREGLAQGARFIMSPADRAYLDMQYNKSTTYGLHWAGYNSVQHAYAWDPDTITAKPDGSDPVVSGAKVVGVEADLWGDRAYQGSSKILQSPLQFVQPSVYADYMAFPRLPEIAEIGWSPRSRHSWSSMRLRLAAQAPRWEAEGIGFYRAPGVPWQ